MSYINIRLTFVAAEVFQTDHRFGLGFPRLIPRCCPWLQLFSLFSRGHFSAVFCLTAKNLAICCWKCRFVTTELELGRSILHLHFLPMWPLSIHMDTESSVLIDLRFLPSPFKLELPCSLFLLVQPLLNRHWFYYLELLVEGKATVSPAGPGVGVLFTCGVGAAPLADMLSR